MYSEKVSIPATIQNEIKPPLSKTITAFESLLSDQGYSQASIHSKVIVIKKFGRWLTS